MPSIALPVSLRGQLLSGSRFNPISLFAAGEQGIWLDPSDLTTMFQDRAGTTPVTTPGQTVGLRLDKSKGLTLGSELVTNGTFDTDTNWNKETGWSISSGSATKAPGIAGSLYQGAATMVQGRIYQITFTVSGYSAGTLTPFCRGAAGTGVTANGTYTQRLFAGADSVYAINFFAGATFVGSIDNISVKELPGNHAVAPTDAARPTYGIEPWSGRRNLLTCTEEFGDAVWQKITSGVGVAPVLTYGFADPDGTSTAWRLQINAGANGASDYSLIRQSSSSWPAIGTRSIWLRSNTGSNQTVTLVATNVNFRVTVTPTWQRFESASSAGAKQLDVSVGGTGSTGATADILIWHPQFEDSATATTYQRVGTAFDVTEAGVPTVHYVQYDGTDDSFSTSSIDFSATDKMSVFAGVRKIADTNSGVIVDNITGSTDGQFQLLSGFSVAGRYAFVSKGSVQIVVEGSGYTSPITNVLTGLGDISGDRATIRVNGTQVAQSTADQGTGNYGNYPLYIGRRGGTMFPFNGRDYGIIIVGKTASASEIYSTESYLAANTSGVSI